MSRPFSRLPLFAAFTMVIVASAACSVLRPSPGSAEPTSSGALAPTNSAERLSDANIAAIVVAANNADIKYAELALAKSQDAEIHKFAMMTKLDHEAVNEAAVSLAKKLKLVPVDNELSFDLRDDAETKRLIFRDLEGFAFDSAYIFNEVSYHEKLLAAIDGALVPSARNAELKALLVSVRPAVAAHLDHAQVLASRKRSRR